MMEEIKNAEKSSDFDVVFGLPANSNGDQIKTLMPTDKFTLAIHDPKVGTHLLLTALLKCQARLIDLVLFSFISKWLYLKWLVIHSFVSNFFCVPCFSEFVARTNGLTFLFFYRLQSSSCYFRILLIIIIIISQHFCIFRNGHAFRFVTYFKFHSSYISK
jgi:hypothetical protein